MATAILLTAAKAAAFVSGTEGIGPIDLRPYLLMQLLPVLLLPAGALGLAGTHSRSGDWLLMLAIHVAAKGFDFADAEIYTATGWIGGHALMHLSLAGVAGVLAYRAANAPSLAVEAGPTQRQTSLNTVA